MEKKDTQQGGRVFEFTGSDSRLSVLQETLQEQANAWAFLSAIFDESAFADLELTAEARAGFGVICRAMSDKIELQLKDINEREGW